MVGANTATLSGEVVIPTCTLPGAHSQMLEREDFLAGSVMSTSTVRSHPNVLLEQPCSVVESPPASASVPFLSLNGQSTSVQIAAWIANTASGVTTQSVPRHVEVVRVAELALF
jgi:hypothetical protein